MPRAFTLRSDHVDALQFAAMDVEERLGTLYRHHLRALSTDAALDLVGMLGKPMSVHMRMPDGFERWFHGIVVEAAQTGFCTIEDLRHAVYAIELAPRPWLLTQRRHSRVFADRTVPEIIAEVLGGIGFTDLRQSLSASYGIRPTCVQYREDDFAFVSRLMEEEGIYYWFTHERDRHVMVLADGIGAHAAAPGAAKLPWLAAPPSAMRDAVGVSSWRAASALHTTTARLSDYDPMVPRQSLDGSADASPGGALHAVDGLESVGFPGGALSAGENAHRAQVMLEARNAARAHCSGETGAWGIGAGALFRLEGSPRSGWNREYLVTGCRLALREAGLASGDGNGNGEDEQPWQCRFEALDSRLAFRSPQATPRPVIAGLQTAIVCDAGGSGEDEAIAVDEHGHVHVIFHWSKEIATNRGDRPQSCPVRVASPWAGKQWGMVHIPRVGQEVVVSFLEGDPDRPLIVGSVYNATHQHPYPLPAEKTRSGIRSRSEGGTADECNEIRFEDRQGSEELFLHAQKDMREEVENDHHVLVEHDEITEVKNDQTGKVGNLRSHEVGKDDTLDVKANATTKVGQKFRLEAGTEIELVTGQSSIVMKSSGEIQIKGLAITVNGQQSIKAEGGVQVAIKAGATMDLKAGAAMTAKSDAMLTVEGGAMATVKAPMLTLQGQALAQLMAALVKIG